MLNDGGTMQTMTHSWLCLELVLLHDITPCWSFARTTSLLRQREILLLEMMAYLTNVTARVLFLFVVIMVNVLKSALNQP